MKNYLLYSLKYFPGWRTNRKIVVFESDDWGSIRMPSKKVYEKLLKRGVPVDKCRYNKFDSLENSEDLLALFDVLSSFKDRNGAFAKFTFFNLVANPDFQKIHKSQFKEYYYESLPKTLSKYSQNHHNVIEIYQQGIKSGVIKPQFHGREHLNINLWMSALLSGNNEAVLGCNHGTFGLPFSSFTSRKNIFMAAFDFETIKELNGFNDIIKEGTGLFKSIFDYDASVFMAPCGIYNREMEKHLASSGISFIQTGVAPSEPVITNNKKKYKKRLGVLGQKNQKGIIYAVRNSSFEPSALKNKDWVSSCLNNIKTAFYWKKPAIISTHRVNYIGSLVESNRLNGIRELKTLLNSIVKTWPEVEFMYSCELGKIMSTKHNRSEAENPLHY